MCSLVFLPGGGVFLGIAFLLLRCACVLMRFCVSWCVLVYVCDLLVCVGVCWRMFVCLFVRLCFRAFVCLLVGLHVRLRVWLLV